MRRDPESTFGGLTARTDKSVPIEILHSLRRPAYSATLKARLTADSPAGRKRRTDIPTSGAASEATA